ncbi:hypothetical protein NSQ91_16470 [Paenibacillus sp. FSL R7-0048]|uniref:hypothetical protein n=1 Tax=Paenibacillus TaxID=44249 RepID=UPI00158DEBDC|nr:MULTISPECIES: hypothetical protein [Paenibacillus]MDH6427554.1 hypothetical protein [Paenibacillus sp. PastH-4]MDH6443584.1 hypothetical protein [Paenibacillus sp. PastF-4]MDH6525712.1 hypothetical protein [Paenibacillus sp. PastH-3]
MFFNVMIASIIAFAFNEVAYHWRWWSVSPIKAGMDWESLRLPTPLVSARLIKQMIT